MIMSLLFSNDRAEDAEARVKALEKQLGSLRKENAALREALELGESEKFFTDKIQELERKICEKDLELFVLAHDLQGPLRKIRGFSGLLSKRYHDQLDETGMKYLSRIDESLTKMNEMCLDLIRHYRTTQRDSQE